MTEPLRIVLIAGEASGDFLGASLMRALKTETQRPLQFFGIGGQLMQAEGLTPFFSYAGINVLGITEVVRSIPTILKKLQATAKKIRDLKPSGVITIDLQGFNARLAKRLADRPFPLIHYVAPTVWAWNAKRAKKIARLYDHLLCLYPFEPDYFTPFNLATTYVGHPLASDVVRPDKRRFFEKFGRQPAATYVALLPGSRAAEISRLMPIFREVLHRLQETVPTLHIVIPTVPEVASAILSETDSWRLPVTVLETFSDRFDAYQACSIAVASSGTVALELAQVGLPMIITYRLSWLSGWLAKRLLKIKYVCLLNLIADKEVVPELLQDKCTVQSVYSAAHRLLCSADDRQQQVTQTKIALTKLKHTNTYASQVAAKKILELLD